MLNSYPRSYVVVDRFASPPESVANGGFVEKRVFLSRSFQVNGYFPFDGATSAQDGSVLVLACLNSPQKWRVGMFGVWMRALRRLWQRRTAVELWLLDVGREHRDRLLGVVASYGLPGSVIKFVPRLNRVEHLQRLRHASLWLDSFPCGGHTSSADALWAGLPFVTTRGLPGEAVHRMEGGGTFSSRVAVSVAANGNVPFLVVDSMREYEDLVVHLGQTPALLSAIRRSFLAESVTATAPLFTTGRTVADLEQAYRAMWTLWEISSPAARGQQPFLEDDPELDRFLQGFAPPKRGIRRHIVLQQRK